MYFILPTCALFAVASAALQTPNALDVSPNLRGGDPAVDFDQRDLAVSGSSSSKSLSTDVSLYKCASFYDACCFNKVEFCNAFTNSWTWTTSAGTDARAVEELCVAAECEAAAFALATAYVEIYGKSTVKVDVKTSGSAADIDISVTLKSATMTASTAQSSAQVSSFASDVAVAYTDAKAACSNSVVKNFPMCKAATSTSTQLGTAAAKAFSYGFTGAVGGSRTYQSADVDVTGSSITSAKACLVSFTQSFSVASSFVTASAASFNQVHNANFNQACLNAYDNHCGSGIGDSYCGMDRQAACNQAYALAASAGIGEACAQAYGEACASALANVNLGVILKVVAGPTGAIKLEQGQYGEACISAFC